MENTLDKRNLPVANLSNQLAFNLSWNLSFREWNVVLYLISQLDSKNQASFEEQVVSVKQLESALKRENKKWGGLYNEVDKLRKSLLSKPIDFYTDVMIAGKPLRGGMNFFEMIVPERGADGSVYIRFKFTQSVKPLLLELHSHFVSIPQRQTKLIKNGHAIRFLIAAKAKRDLMRNHESVSSLKYSLDDFRNLLGIPGKYPDFRNFRRSVIHKIEKEINERCDFLEVIKVTFYPLRSKPKTAVEFLVADRNGGSKQLTFLSDENLKPAEKDLASLSRSRLYAYEILIEFGVSPGIAYQQILSKVKGSEFSGFEDWYITQVLNIFSNKTNIKKTNRKGRAGAFVKWFLHTSFADDQFSELMEKTHARKKKLQREDPEAWENRLIAKDMTADAFAEYYKNLKENRVG